jgi:hypothetical protein
VKKQLCPVETVLKVVIAMLLIPMWLLDDPYKNWLEWIWTMFFVGIVVFINMDFKKKTKS